MSGLEEVIANVNADDRLLIVDDVFDSGGTIKAVLETIRKQARANTYVLLVLVLVVM